MWLKGLDVWRYIISYLIAFVRFSESELDYPVECYRTDIKPSEEVVIRLANSTLKSATVVRMAYLNWDCKGRIECKLSEAATKKLSPEHKLDIAEITVGLTTIEAMMISLRKTGWTPLKPVSKQYRIAASHCNKTQTANIFFRKNGVDLQILAGLPSSRPGNFSNINISLSEGRVVRHFLSQTTFNLYEGINRFAISFLANEGNYDRFFKPVGSSDRATQEVKNRVHDSGSESLRDALAGCEDGAGRIYLSDGIYL